MDGGVALSGPVLLEQLATLSLEVENIRSLFLQLDSKVSSEQNLRQTLEADFEDRMRSVDWQCYSQELAAACDELQKWRDGIEEDRECFKQSLKQELVEELAGRADNARKAVDDEARNRMEAIQRLEQRYQDVTSKLSTEMESRSRDVEMIRETLKAQGDERNRILTLFDTQREEVQKISKEVQDVKQVMCSDSIPKSELNLPSSEEVKELQDQWQAAHDTMTKEVSKLSGQVKEAPPLLLELTIQLQTLQQSLSTESNERNMAIDNLARKVELVSTVFNIESKQGKPENAEEALSQSTRNQLQEILDQLDTLANTQLSSLREQLGNCTQQLALEQAERKSDSEMVWSSMQSLHGHLVQFISQPPAPGPVYTVPESQRSLGRMPRSRSPSPRIPVALQQEAQQPANPGRPRPLVQLQAPPGGQPVALGSAQVLRSYQPGINPQLSWTQQDLSSGQNISFARHLLTQTG